MRLLGPENEPVKGRGASHDVTNRFERLTYELDLEHCDPDQPAPATQFYRDASRTILASNDSPDVGFEFSINPYRGCEHGCIYCYARPSHEYLGFSPGLDFETKIMVKEDAPQLLRQALRSPKWQPQMIMISGVTDCYQPIERKLKLTRACLEVLAEFRNPVGVITKNWLVTRDIDVISELARHNAAVVNISITTLDLNLNRILEPRSSSPAQRLDAVEQLAKAGIPVGVMVAPVIPGLTDSEMPKILEASAKAGASRAGYVMLRLPHAVAPLFEQWLTEHYPERKEKILNRLRSLREGKLYDSTYGTRMRGEGPFAEQVRTMFDIATRRFGLTQRGNLSTESFRRPVETGDQVDLFSEQS